VQKVVITGSGGRVGRAVFVQLAADHEVVGIDRLPCSTAVKHVGDVCDRALLERAFAGADAIVHAAALHAPHVGVVPDDEVERVNVGGTEMVIAAARAAGVRRIVFTSTTALYGGAIEHGRSTWIDEDVLPAPLTIYHRTKLAAEGALRAAADRSLQVRVLRMSRCFPEPADLMAVYRLHRGIDVRDVASAHVAALGHQGEAFHAWVLSSATPFQRSDLTALADDAPPVLRARAPALVDVFAARGWTLPRTIDRVYDASRACRELGWRPRHGFDAVLDAFDRQDGEILPPALGSR
jgi:nucleoside-diphosphate-sugar epimerase